MRLIYWRIDSLLYILCGNECNFKTTVANKLSEKLNLPIIKGSSFELSQCTNEELYNHFFKIAVSDNLIVDRYIYSNLTYASLYDDYAILSKNQKEYLELILDSKAKVIYLFADDNVLKERMKVRGDDYVDESMLSVINKKFHSVMTTSTLNPTWYDTNDWTSDEIVNDLLGGK